MSTDLREFIFSKRLLKLELLLIVLCVVLITSCSPNRRPGLAHGNRVEYRHGSKILIQPFGDRDEVNYYQTELKLRPELQVGGRTLKGHSFEIQSSASCKLSKQPPDKVVVTIIHDIADRKMWHFPAPAPSEALEPDASIDLIFVADGGAIKTGRGYQTELQKDLPSDRTFYDSLIVEIPFAAFTRIANSRTVEMRLGSGSFMLDSETLSALRDFAEIMKTGVDPKTLP